MSEVLANRQIQNDVKTSLGTFETVDKNAFLGLICGVNTLDDKCKLQRKVE